MGDIFYSPLLPKNQQVPFEGRVYQNPDISFLNLAACAPPLYLPFLSCSAYFLSGKAAFPLQHLQAHARAQKKQEVVTPGKRAGAFLGPRDFEGNSVV